MSVERRSGRDRRGIRGILHDRRSREAIDEHIEQLLADPGQSHLGEYLRAQQEAYEALESLAYHDHLTGLLNRNGMDVAASLVSRPTPLGTDWLLLCDLDNFKAVNDTYGHEKGDEVLIATARHFGEHFRQYDIGALLRGEQGDAIGRHGGDEMVMLLRQIGPGTRDLPDADEAELVGRQRENLYGRIAAFVGGYAERMREHLPEGPHVTMSVGGTPILGSYTEALKEADRRLYEAKEGGKNNVILS